MPAVFQYAVEFARHFWDVLAEMAPYLLFGFLMAGVLSELLPRKFVERHLSGRGPWPSVKGALLGVPMPLCSCGVIPVAAGIRKNGASRGATISFLIATPQTGMDNILVTWSLLGPLFAIYSVVVTFLTGLSGGWLVDWLVREPDTAPPPQGHDPTRCTDPQCCYCRNGENNHAPVAAAGCDDDCCGGEHAHAHHAPARRGPLAVLQRMLHYGLITLPRDIAGALAVGLAISGVITTLIPHDFFTSRLGGWVWLEYAAMLAISIPMYVCATASVPIAAALIASGISPGAAFVFLVAGPTTNGGAIATIWQLLGRKTALIYLGVVALGALLAGLLLDRIYVATHTAPAYYSPEVAPAWYSNVSAVALILLIAVALWPAKRQRRESKMSENEMTSVLKVGGMTCSHCVATVTRVLGEQPGVKQVRVDLADGTATVVGQGYDMARLIAALTAVGYPAQPA